jgi:hypothetical protein
MVDKNKVNQIIQGHIEIIWNNVQASCLSVDQSISDAYASDIRTAFL